MPRLLFRRLKQLLNFKVYIMVDADVQTGRPNIQLTLTMNRGQNKNGEPGPRPTHPARPDEVK